MYRVRNEEVHRRLGFEMKLASTVDQQVLRGLHVEKIDEYHMAKRVLMVDVSGVLVWGRLRPEVSLE